MSCRTPRAAYQGATGHEPRRAARASSIKALRGSVWTKSRHPPPQSHGSPTCDMPQSMNASTSIALKFNRAKVGSSGAGDGRASCRERVWPYVEHWVLAGHLKKKKKK